MEQDLRLIKKHYGEKMMHLCRELFPTLLEEEGCLSKLILDNFAPSRFLYDDLIENQNIEGFKNYIYSLVNVEKDNEIKVHKHPRELLAEVGYDFYECKTEEDIQKFKKYYTEIEKLCTFNGGRLNSCYVFFAVKKNVDEIKRENFSNPKRQDEYGTSVISIQFSRGNNNTLSIKNRYNHTVNNPDATFSNNLENIIEGLTESFERTYNLNINQNDYNDFELDDYVKADDGKYYKYNYEIDNVYYCPNNIVIDNFEVKQLPKEKYIVIDYFIINLINGTIGMYDNYIEDSFIYDLKNIKKINITKDKNTNNKSIELLLSNDNKAIIEIDKYNRIIGYINNDIISIKKFFLRNNEYLKKIQLNKLRSVGKDFLCCNESLETLDLPNLEIIDDFFLYYNQILHKLNLPNVIKIGDCFLCDNSELLSINLPKVIEIGSSFLSCNNRITNLELPKVKFIKDWFMNSNTSLENLELPELKSIKDYFLHKNKILEKLNLPSVNEIGDSFLINNKNLTNIDFPELKKIGDFFIAENTQIREVNLPKVDSIGSLFLGSNYELTHLNLPSAKKVRDDFLRSNVKLIELEMPNLVSVEEKFLYANTNLKKLDLPKIKYVGDSFLCSNECLQEANLPLLERIGIFFLYNNNGLINLSLPNLKNIGSGFLTHNQKLLNLNIPSVENVGRLSFEYNQNKVNLYAPNLNIDCIKNLNKNFIIIQEQKDDIYDLSIIDLKKSDTDLSEKITETTNKHYKAGGASKK